MGARCARLVSRKRTGCGPKSPEAACQAYQEKDEEIGAEELRGVEREVYMAVLDTLWMQHLENMQHLREGIYWRSVGQRDPLVEYRESQKLFTSLQENLRTSSEHTFHIHKLTRNSPITG